jgi:hypothetical protein
VSDGAESTWPEDSIEYAIAADPSLSQQQRDQLLGVVTAVRLLEPSGCDCGGLVLRQPTVTGCRRHLTTLGPADALRCAASP